MPANPEAVTPSKGMLWAGRIITGFTVLFLAFDGVIKLMKVPAVAEASEKLGLPASTTLGIGAVLLACTVIYVIPRTAVLGAILLTGYLGGATAIHVRAESGAFPIIFSLAFGLLVWVGLLLRRPRLLRTMLAGDPSEPSLP